MVDVELGEVDGVVDAAHPDGGPALGAFAHHVDQGVPRLLGVLLLHPLRVVRQHLDGNEHAGGRVGAPLAQHEVSGQVTGVPSPRRAWGHRVRRG